jgi:hypothetical protein
MRPVARRSAARRGDLARPRCDPRWGARRAAPRPARWPRRNTLSAITPSGTTPTFAITCSTIGGSLLLVVRRRQHVAGLHDPRLGVREVALGLSAPAARRRGSASPPPGRARGPRLPRLGVAASMPRIHGDAEDDALGVEPGARPVPPCHDRVIREVLKGSRDERLPATAGDPLPRPSCSGRVSHRELLRKKQRTDDGRI